MPKCPKDEAFATLTRFRAGLAGGRPSPRSFWKVVSGRLVGTVKAPPSSLQPDSGALSCFRSQLVEPAVLWVKVLYHTFSQMGQKPPQDGRIQPTKNPPPLQITLVCGILEQESQPIGGRLTVF